MSDLYVGPNRITAVIETRAGEEIGFGPLVSILALDYGYRLSESGDFNATVALADPRCRFVEPKSTVLAFYYDQEFLFRGLVEYTGKAVDNAGILRMTIRGRDLTGELAEAPVGTLALNDGLGSGVSNGPALILGAANAFNGTTWALDTTNGYSTTSALLYGQYSHESALGALIMAAEKTGEHFRIASDGTRKIVWLRTDTTDSEVQAVASAGEPVQAEDNPHICFIQSFAEEISGYDLVTRIYPYGAGDGEARVTLFATNRAAPSGFTLNAAQNYIESENAVAAFGKSIGEPRRYQDIRELSNTSADRTGAANQLFDAALADLQRNDDSGDIKRYTMKVLKLPRRVSVGNTITVEYYHEAYSVDREPMVILAIRQRIGADGARFSELTVAGVARWLEGVSRKVIGGMEQGRLFTAHPQRGPNSDTQTYQKYVWRDVSNSATAKLRFRLGPRITQLVQVAFDFETDDGTRMLPLESTVRSVAGVSTSTSSGGSSTPTTSSGGSQTPTSDSGGSSAPTSSAGSTHSHTVTIAGHTHGVPGHQHDITVAGGGAGTALGHNVAGGFAFLTKAAAGNLILNTNVGSGATTSDSGGSSTPTSSNESTHTHTVTIAGHTHTVTVAGHTHTVTTGDHAHNVTANIQTTYGVYREGNSLTFNLADLEYRVNNLAWADVAADALSLGDNWYRLDLTEFLYDGNFFPLQENNFLEFKRKDAGSFASRVSCMIDGQLSVDSIIQSVSLV